MKSYIIAILVLLLITGCYSEKESQIITEENPPMEDFNIEESDSRAIAIADSVMKKMGGRKLWDETRYISWTFFGRRKLLWDKREGNVRIEFLNDPSTIYLVNVNSMQGKAMKAGEEITHPDSLAKELKRAQAIWINDSYWLFMPFKLKDSGVTLKYLRQDTTMTGAISDVLQLTFEEVGNTPNNKYEIWVNRHEGLITQWAYFQNSAQDSASFIRPFDNYRRYGKILLSGDRSDNGGPGNIRVMESVPDGFFTSFDSFQQ